MIGLENNKKFIESNLGLVHLCANKFRSKGIDYDDLYGAGCVGLLKAAKGFDRERGVKFSTYAVPVILGEIKRLFRDGGTIKVSRGLKELSLKITQIRERFIQSKGREPTIEELSKLADIPEEDVVEALNVSLPPLSLAGGYDDDANAEIDIPVSAPDEEITNSLTLKQVLSSLDKKDAKLIYLRYFHNKTQTETAKILDMTQVQVSRREKKLLLTMREKMT